MQNTLYRKLKPDQIQQRVPGRGPYYDGGNVVCVDVFLAVGSVEDKIELVFWVVKDHSPQNVVRECSNTFQAIRQQQAGINGDLHVDAVYA
jgi:hypothetical protein